MSIALLALSVSFAQSGESPLVIRYDAAGTSVVEPLVARVSANGESAEIPLKDDGERPDPGKGDGRFAGVGRLAGKEVTVELVSAGKSLGTATATFADTDAPRDVDLSLAAGKLTATASMPGANAPGAPATPGGEVAAGGAPGPDGAPSPGGAPAEGAPGGGPAGGPPGAAGGPGGGAPDPAANGVAFQSTGGQDRRPPVTFPGDEGGSSDGLLFIGFGVGLLALLGVGWMWSRRAGAAGRARGAEVQPIPEPGLLAPELPSLSDGLVAWTADDPAPLVQPLLALLADRHRVLVVSRGGAEVRPVAGGPVYRVTGIRPSIVGDAAEALAREGGPPLVVLLLLDAADGDLLKDYRDLLPAEVGGVVLLGRTAETPLPRVEVGVVSEGVWALTHGAHRVTVRAGAGGLERIADA